MVFHHGEASEELLSLSYRSDENLKHVVHVIDLRFFWLEIFILPCYVYVDCVYAAHHSCWCLVHSFNIVVKRP